MKTCTKCGEDKSLKAFSRNRTKPDGRQAFCKLCMTSYRPQNEFVTVRRQRDGKLQEYTRRGPNHGDSKTVLYRVWKGMRERCHNPKAQNYRFYGGRGIQVCPEWYADWLVFKAWAMESGFESGMQLERRDNDQGYGPENCCWLTRTENLRHRRAYLPVELEERLREEAVRRDIPVYALIREAIEAHLGSERREEVI